MIISVTLILKFLTSFFITAISTIATLGIAFSFVPPLKEHNFISKFFFTSSKNSVNILLAFILPLSISIPEWPPIRFLTPSIKKVYVSFEKLAFSSTKSITTVLPPAEPAVRSPSASESTLIKYFPVKRFGFNPNAPFIVVSSSTVPKNSICGCSKLLSSKIARDMATAIPLSAPRVVASALK